MDNTEFLYSRTIIFIQLLMPFCSLDEMFVGASLLAKVVNDSACIRANRDALDAFASRLAPTVAAIP